MSNLEARIKRLEDANGGGWTGHKPGARTVTLKPLESPRYRENSRERHFREYGFDIEDLPVATAPAGPLRARKFVPLVEVLKKLKNLGKEARVRLAKGLGYLVIYPTATGPGGVE